MLLPNELRSDWTSLETSLSEQEMRLTGGGRGRFVSHSETQEVTSRRTECTSAALELK